MIIYSAQDSQGQAQTLEPGVPFTTYWLDGEPATYTHPWNALDIYGAADLARFGITSAPATLAQAQAQQLQAVQVAKAAALASMQYAVGGSTYTVTLTPLDQLDVQTQLQLLSAQPAGTTIEWEIVPNTFLTWELADLQALQSAGISHVKAVYANAQALVAQINSASTAAACLAINTAAGWPA